MNPSRGPEETGHPPRRGRRRAAVVVLVVVAVVGALSTIGGNQGSTIEPLLRARWVGAFDHDPTSGELHALVDLRSSHAVPAERRLVTLDPVSGASTVHREGFDMPFGAWVGLGRDGAVWAFSAGSSSGEPFLWRLDASGEITEVPVVRLFDLGCDAVDEGRVDELGVRVDEGVLRPRVLLIDRPGVDPVAVDIEHELRFGPRCGPEARELTTPADLERNLQDLAIDGWLETAAAGSDALWVDSTQELEIREVSAGLLARLTGNNPCERVQDRIRWQGRRMNLDPCRGIGALPTSGHVVTDDGLVVGLALRGVGLLQP